MPPRHSKDTPQSTVPVAPPPARTRRVTRANTAVVSKGPSPKIIGKKALDGDKVFRTQRGGKGSLKYDEDQEHSVHESDMEQDEVSPTPGPSKKPKVLPVKAEKVAGSRRVPPRPIKQKVQVSIPRSRARRNLSRNETDSEVEIVQDVPSREDEDEGYESEGDEGADIEPKQEDGDEDMGSEALQDEVDDDGNLRGFIDDEAEDEDAEEECEDDGMDIDVEEQGDNERESSLPVRISKPLVASSKKRGATNLSDAEDMPAARKRRSGQKEESEKPIQAIGHTSKVTLNRRAKEVEGDKKKTTFAGIERKPKVKHIEEDEEMINHEENKVKSNTTVKGMGRKSTVKRQAKVKHVEEVEEKDDEEQGPVVKDTIIKGKGKGKAKEVVQPEEVEEEGEEGEGDEEVVDEKEGKAAVEPQDIGCEVTDPAKQSTLLIGSYGNLVPLKGSTLALSNPVEMASLDALMNKDIFSEDIDPGRIQAIVTTVAIPTASISNPARDDPKNLVLRTAGTGSAISLKGAKSGELADIIVFGFVVSSNLVEGRTYKTYSGGRQLKDLGISPIEQDGDRLFAALSATLGPKIHMLNTSEDGAVNFSTKHTAVDEDGEPEKKAGGLGGKFITKALKAGTKGVVHKDIQRRAREGTDMVPVFDSTANFLTAPGKSGPWKSRAEEVLTQRKKADPYWTKELPQGSFVAVHSTVTTYSAKDKKGKFLSFNLLAVQLLALPKDA